MHENVVLDLAPRIPCGNAEAYYAHVRFLVGSMISYSMIYHIPPVLISDLLYYLVN